MVADCSGRPSKRLLASLTVLSATIRRLHYGNNPLFVITATVQKNALPLLPPILVGVTALLVV